MRIVLISFDFLFHAYLPFFCSCCFTPFRGLTVNSSNRVTKRLVAISNENQITNGSNRINSRL